MTGTPRSLWIAITVVLALGLAIDALRKSSSGAWKSQISAFGLNNLENNLENDSADGAGVRGRSPRSSQAARARSRLNRDRVGALAGQSGNPQPTAAAASAAAVPVAPTAGGSGPSMTSNAISNATSNATSNSGADDRKPEDKKAEKKKKKKKKKSTLPDSAAAEPAAHVDSTDASDQDNSGGGNSTAVSADGRFAGGGAGAPAHETDEPKSLEEWIQYILREPNYERTLKLITLYQTRDTSAEIFYGVINEMLADSREKMHEYAILALGSAPSAASFKLLQTAAKHQSEGSDLRVQARTYLKAYARIENVRYLLVIVSASETSPDITEEIRFEALRTIRLSAEQNLRTSNQPSASSGTGGGPIAANSASSRQFNPMVPVLTRLSQTSTQASIRTEATATLERIKSLMGTTVAAAN